MWELSEIPYYVSRIIDECHHENWNEFSSRYRNCFSDSKRFSLTILTNISSQKFNPYAQKYTEFMDEPKNFVS